MFGAIKLTKNTDPDKYKYSGYRIGFDSCSEFFFTDGSYLSLSEQAHNKEKDILIIGEGPAHGLDDTTLTEEAKYSINFTQSKRKFVLSLHNNGSNSFSFVNATKIHQFKANDSEIKNLLWLGSISKDFTSINMKKTGLNCYVYDFSVDHNIINTNNIIDIHKYLMKNI